MSKRTIAKFSIFVILFTCVGVLAQACSKAKSTEVAARDGDGSSLYQKPVVIGRIASNDVIESSGIAASKCQPDIYWTHNDAGDDAYIFAFNAKGDNLGTWRVAGAQNQDWEDIAAYKDATGQCFLYIGDIGDNKDKRPEHTIYRVKEPAVGDATRNTGTKNALMTQPAEALPFRFPDTNQNDAETLMVNPSTGDIYVVTKRIDGPSGVYKFAGAFTGEKPVTAEKVASVAVPSVPNGQLTGGDISPDGKHVVVCDYSGAYEFELPAAAKTFDEIWGARPGRVDLGRLPQGEAVGYTADGRSIIATSEKKHPPIIEVRRTR